MAVLQLAGSAKMMVLCLSLRCYRLGDMSARAQVAQHSKITDCSVWVSQALSIVCIVNLNYSNIFLDKK